MAWTKVEGGFFVQDENGCKHIDIAVCSNCNGIHIPAEVANGCIGKDGVEHIHDLKKRYNRFSPVIMEREQ